MAAKQGLTAQVFQASEDARRAVLSRAPTSVRSHSWLSNLNTTCTIKSAPPRTPEVMSMLSTKSGWLIKRNEQNVWQRRWCCVVPHSFLYYFEAEPIEAAAAAAAAAGMDFPLSPIGEGGEFTYNNLESSFQSTKNGKGGSKENYTNIQPVGIIDLECYTTVDRTRDDLILELTGDSVTNPDLRSFHFQGESPDDCEQWTKAFLNDRHSSLKDEREAYMQICENFPLQLMHCSEMMDAAEEKQKIAEKKAYHIRSAAEDSRKKVIQMVREALEQDRGEDGINDYYRDDGEMDMNERRLAFMKKLDSVGAQAVSMNAGVSESVEILTQYAETLRQDRAEFGRDLRDMHERVKDLGHSMISRTEMEETQSRLERAMKTNQVDRARMTERITSLEKLLKKERQERADAERTLEAKNMEFTMLSAASKQKIQELSGHKKILKKEVIELRKKVEDIVSDATVYKHKTDGLDIQVKAEQERNRVLERHLHHVTEQIKVQERVMDCMMSQSGSVYGESRMGDMNSIGGNSSYRGDTGSRAGRYPPLRSDSSKRNGYSNELPRYPAASPRNVPTEITSNPPAIPINSSKTDEFNKSMLSDMEEENKKTEIYDSVSRDRSSHASRDNDLPHDQDVASEDENFDDDNDVDDDHDDDEESRGNLSELTEDRTFRSDTFSGVSPTKQKQPQSPAKIPKSLMEETRDTEDPINSNQSQQSNGGMPPPIDIVRNSSSRSRRLERDTVPRPPLSVEKSGTRNTRVSSFQSQSHKIISNIPLVEPQFTNTPNSHNHHSTHDNGSIAMSSIHSGASATSNGTGKLSVAQRARLEADNTSRTKVVKAPKHVLDSMKIETNMSTASTTSSHDPTSPSSGSVWSRLGAKIVDTIDNSAFAVNNDGQGKLQHSDDESSSEESGSSDNKSEEKSSTRQRYFAGNSNQTSTKYTIDHHPTTSSTTTTATTTSTSTMNKNLSLAQRQQLQREKQVAFLKQQGLLRDDED